MENASKALIIAGAILLAILIISLGILIYNQASGVVGNNTMSEVDIQTFNQKFTQYVGEQRGSAVRSLIQQVQASNAAEGNEQRQVNINVDLDDIETGEIYDVVIAEDDYAQDGPNQGLITNITVNDT